MKEFKGTKGEWKITESKHSRSIIGTNKFSLVDVWYDMSDSFDTKEKGLANAKLIASAPELLKALIELKRWVTDTHIAKDALTQANKAINKALN